jgi:hypothetical protein
MGYELYSWQQPNGSWSFSLLPSPSGVNVSAQEVFNMKFHLSGVKELKRKTSGLPAGATIYWLSRISGTDQKAKEGEKLSYPPSETFQDIRHYAEARKSKWRCFPANRRSGSRTESFSFSYDLRGT